MKKNNKEISQTSGREGLVDAKESARRGSGGRAFPEEGLTSAKPGGRDHLGVFRKQEKIPAKPAS